MEQAQALPNFAETYDRVVVPAIFDRYARDLVERARPIGPSDRILDLGCGTGIVSRVLRERLGGAARITGVDVNAGMLAVARARAPEVDWREANAMTLPFADASFDLILCQEMIQFVPDRAAAIREARRVLAPGGRLVLSTWRSRAEQPFHEALGLVAERHLGASNDKRWSMGDADAVRALLVTAGFTGVRAETASLTEHYTAFPARMSALAAGFDLSSLQDDERERRLAAVEKDSEAVLAGFAVAGGGFEARSCANVIFAAVPR